MKHIVRLLTTFNLLLIALAIKANDKGQVYRAVYELNEIYTYIGNNREPDISDERSEAKFRKDILRLELYPESSFCYSYHTWMTDSLKWSRTVIRYGMKCFCMVSQRTFR